MDLSEYASEIAVLHDETVRLFLKKKSPSDYIGDGYIWEPAGTLQCSILPVTDKLTVETYGPRVEQMMLLHAAPGAPIADGMGVSFTDGATGPDYTVVSAKPRMTHTYALIEVNDIGSQG